MTVTRHLSWENFRGTVLLPGEQRVHRVVDAPILEIFGDGIANRIGMWIEVPANAAIPKSLVGLVAIRTQLIEKDRRTYVEVSTTARSLQKQFYYFATAVAEQIAINAQPALDAVVLELQSFVDLLEQEPVLGIERQIGLIGELLVLQHLIEEGGAGLVQAWISPTAEPHDFRIGSCEFEVKTTVKSHRTHTIHGAEQLVPSAGCLLTLVSILLGPPGAGTGFSLKGLVDILAMRLDDDRQHQLTFTKLLAASGYRDEDSAHYLRRFVLRRPLAVIAVDKQFPAITRPAIQKVLGPEAQRIDQLQYDIDVEGLGHENAVSEFASAIYRRGART